MLGTPYWLSTVRFFSAGTAHYGKRGVWGEMDLESVFIENRFRAAGEGFILDK